MPLTESLDDLLWRLDFVPLAVSLRSQTQRLAGKRELSLMKPTAIVISVGRGTYRSLLSTGHGAGRSCWKKHPGRQCL